MDDIFEKIGAFGRYQKLVLILVGLSSSMTATLIYSTVFTTASPRFACSRLNDSLIDFPDSSLTTCQMWSELKRNSSAPYECTYDKTYYEETLVTELDLVCDKAWMVSLTTTIYLAGAVSGLFIGFFSDRFGRKWCAFVLSFFIAAGLSIWLLFIFKLIQVNDLTKYILFCILQFICGIMGKSLYLMSYILIFELTTSQYKTIVTSVFSYMYVFGEFLVLVVAYIAPDWEVFAVFLSIYAIIIVILIAIFMPESPQFLMSMKHKDRLNKMLKTIAKLNGKVNDIQEITDKEIELENVENNELSEQKSTDPLEKQEVSFIMDKTNLIKIGLFVYIWFALSLSYYGVSLGITSIDENFNPYLMYLLSSLAELAGIALCHLNDKFGRRRMMITFLVSSTVICLAVAFLPGSNSNGSLTWTAILKIIFASIGKMVVSAAFMSCYVYCSTLFPTNIRTTALLFSSNLGGIGSVISPQINLLQTLVWAPLPYFIFGSSALLASIFVIFLPDPDKVKF